MSIEGDATWKQIRSRRRRRDDLDESASARLCLVSLTNAGYGSKKILARGLDHTVEQYDVVARGVGAREDEARFGVWTFSVEVCTDLMVNAVGGAAGRCDYRGRRFVDFPVDGVERAVAVAVGPQRPAVLRDGGVVALNACTLDRSESGGNQSMLGAHAARVYATRIGGGMRKQNTQDNRRSDAGSRVAIGERAWNLFGLHPPMSPQRPRGRGFAAVRFFFVFPRVIAHGEQRGPITPGCPPSHPMIPPRGP